MQPFNTADVCHCTKQQEEVDSFVNGVHIQLSFRPTSKKGFDEIVKRMI
jgi:hypothetical protein